jgi:hypothetical protein
MMRCRIGSRNAAVLPLPVAALARMSRPSRAGGIASDWIGVGRVNPSSRIALRRLGCSCSDVKGTQYPYAEVSWSVNRSRSAFSPSAEK